MPASMISLACSMPLPKRYWNTGISLPLAVFSAAIDLVDLRRASRPAASRRPRACRPVRAADHHAESARRRRADVDDVDVVHGEQVVETGDAAFDAELVGQRVGMRSGLRSQSASTLNLSGLGTIALDDVAAADAAADRRRRCRCLLIAATPFPASASSARSAPVSIALKQRSCVIAVSVRLSTSCDQLPAVGQVDLAEQSM